MSLDRAREELKATRLHDTKISAMGDQAWAAMAEHQTEIVAQCENYSLPPVVRMAVCMVAAELFKRQGDVLQSEAESMIPPVTNEEG